MAPRSRRRVRAASLGSLLLAGAALVLTACTGTATPTRTVTVTAAPSPAATVTVTATATQPAQLLPREDDLADMAYRSGAAGSDARFTVPKAGYEIRYLCRTDGRSGATAGLDARGGDDSSRTMLVCDDTIHAITVDAATVGRTGRAGTLRMLAFSGDRQDVLGIDLTVRALQ